ncbi:hypothetical protein H8356DRAFT_1422827 [Neocallimastix lanati (nom. inval.)]|jgi:hypothetical protein|nr:hypothetical protein H8356DRAFT_1422827 [Neocallimastix sp. JGI-2020a]
MKCFILFAIFLILNVSITYSINCEEVKTLLNIEYEGNCCDLQQVNCDENNEEILSIESLIDEDYVESERNLYRRKGGGGRSGGSSRSSGGSKSGSSGSSGSSRSSGSSSSSSSSVKSGSSSSSSSSGSSVKSGSSSSSSSSKTDKSKSGSSSSSGSSFFSSSSSGRTGYFYGYHHSSNKNKVKDCEYDELKKNDSSYNKEFKKKCCIYDTSKKNDSTYNKEYNKVCSAAFTIKSTSYLWIVAAMLFIQLLL